jgi:hypothetical protein
MVGHYYGVFGAAHLDKNISTIQDVSDSDSDADAVSGPYSTDPII